MAILKFSHEENWCGLRHDFYYCDKCGKQICVQHGTAPNIDECPECEEPFEEVDFNDQI